MKQVVEPEGPKVPPLESGDHLTQPEFHDRYESSSRVKKAELIEGVVFMPSPVSDLHSGAHSKIIGWLEYFTSHDDSLAVRTTPTLILDDCNEYQPDAVLRRVKGPNAASWVDADGYLRGPPELVVEIAVTSAAIDLREKKEVYRRNGVAEYVVWQVMDEKLTWWRLSEGAYEPIEASEKGLLESRIFPGLRLDINALLQGDMATVLKRLEG